MTGLALEVKLEADDRGDEEVQVFWHTLRRPLWWAGACWTASVPADGCWHRIEQAFPEGLPGPEDDELLQIRIDPRHRAGGFALRRFELTLGDRS